MKDKNYRYDKKWKIILLSFAALIFVLSLIYTNKLMKDLRQEEYRRMELWSHAMGEFINSDPETDIGFLFEVLENNKTIPVILVDFPLDIFNSPFCPFQAFICTDNSHVVPHESADLIPVMGDHDQFIGVCGIA